MLLVITCAIIFSILISCQPEENLPIISVDLDYEMKGKKGGYSILSVNVGNSDLTCHSFDFKLCHNQVRDRIAANIKQLHPDIVVIQELLGSEQCTQEQMANSKHICYQLDKSSQARQLVGNNYTIMMDNRNHHEAVAVHTDIGKIIGCGLTEECTFARTAPSIPGCIDDFSVSATTIQLNSGFVFDLINAHPTSRNVTCRASMINQIFTQSIDYSALIEQNRVMISGDFNLDPWREKDESTLIWATLFDQGWAGKPFNYHSGVAEINPPHYTFHLLIQNRTIDFIVSNFAKGVVYVLGETPGTNRLDGGSGMDHRGLFGWLLLEEVP